MEAEIEQCKIQLVFFLAVLQPESIHCRVYFVFPSFLWSVHVRNSGVNPYKGCNLGRLDSCWF